jgi:voltage-gated potassium channel
MRIREEARQLLRAALLALVVFAVGMIGYGVLAGDRYGFIDIAYMTVITLTTVGFGEVIDLSASPAGRLFTIFLILGGVGSILYLLSSLAAFLSDGNIQRLTWVRAMKRKAESLNEHVIVCGGGTVGMRVIDELHATGRAFVLIELNEATVRELHERVGENFPAIIGDATEDERLREAGIDQAAGVISALGQDNENLIVVVSARMLRPDIRIVTRCTNIDRADKLRRAGADSVVSPTTIGGMRLSSEMVRPSVVSFLDHMLHDKEEPLRVEDWTITERSPLAHKTVGDVRALKLDQFLVIALSDDQDNWQFNPGDAAELEPGLRLIFMSSPEDYRRFSERAGGTS